MKTHDLILYYGQTRRLKNPLILVVGREPNNNIPYNNRIGKHDFRAPFWQRTHVWIGDVASISKLRAKCISNDCSPIIYANISPRAILHEKNNKGKLRKRIPNKEFERHINHIFSKKIIKRVKLIILGIGEVKQFSYAVKYFKNKAKKVRIIETAFLYPTNKRKIMKELLKYRKYIRKIVKTYA